VIRLAGSKAFFIIVAGCNQSSLSAQPPSAKPPWRSNSPSELGAEIISADSMQVYRGMDIGTAKDSRRYSLISATFLSLST